MEMHSQAIVTTIRDKCFDLCLSSAGSSLSTKDKTCIKNCSERYIDTMKLVVQSLTSQSH
ncbi:Tim8-Tim13 [Blastocystis hominis]|uniref:Mitochondrial import inner membrane translocase subunit n=1 Tax=Blastocystis hominis TaxID=12968 RepID=D8M223_BLAHO|nr:Tim8-Tim13 [Blastocystis hominis]CBK22112.2 Tim8-Tim13 [Blastocystis hominis]|eukprot:XP_012896160.1 Tim8-Tim13 [Blastocystis hominis]